MSQTSTKNRQAAVGRPNPWVTILLLLIVVALAVLPLVINPGAEYGGADGQAGAAIGEINGSYQPWFESIWSPPSGEIESLLFALQAAIGSGVVFFGLGYLYGRSRSGRETDVPASGKSVDEEQ